MKEKLSRIILLFFLLWNGVAVARAQSQSTLSALDTIKETIDGQLFLKLKPYSDKIVLRWAINNSAAWLAIREVGVKIDRIILDENNKPISKDWETLTLEPIRPWDELTFKNKVLADTSNNSLLMVAEAFYGASSVKDASIKNFEGVEDASMEFENKFILALMGADMNPTAAEALGTRYEDKQQVNSKYKYAYKVYPGAILPSIFRIDTAFFITQGSLKDEKYYPRNLKAKGTDSRIGLQLPRDKSFNTYGSYYFERSIDGKNFVQIHKEPVVFNEMDSSANYLFIDSVSNYTTYYYRVKGLDAFGDMSAYSPVVSAMATNNIAPPAGQLYASLTGADVNLNWVQEKYNDRPLAGFIVRRGRERNDLNEYLTEKLLPATQTKYVDTPSDLTKGMYYQVISVDTAGNYSGTNVQYVFAYDSIPPAAPVGLKALVDSTGIVRLNWSPDYVDNIQGYRVFTSNYRDGDFSPISSDFVRDTVFVDTLSSTVLNKQVYYRLVAVDGNSNHSPFSEILTVERPKMVKTPSAVIKDYKVSKNAVDFNWEIPLNHDCIHIKVLRKISTDTTWQTIADLPIQARSYRDSSVTESKTYDYAIVLIDQQGRWSEVSYPLTVFQYASTKNVLSNLKLKENDKKISLSWEVPKGTEVSYYILYKDKGEGLEQFDSVDGKERKVDLMNEKIRSYGIKAVYPDNSKSDLMKFL